MPTAKEHGNAISSFDKFATIKVLINSFSLHSNAHSTKFGIFTKTFYAEDIYDHRIVCASHAEGLQPAPERKDFLAPADG